MNEYTRIKKDEVRIARVIGENEEGITLFVPKSLEGKFHLEGGEHFLSFVFVKAAGNGMTAWIPWADGPVIKS